VITFSVPIIPPSVNHYVKHTKAGVHYKDKKATEAFEQCLALAVHQSGSVVGEIFKVTAVVTLGPGQKLDVDNPNKLILDSLKRAGAFVSPAGKELSDSWVFGIETWKRRGPEPRTDIKVESLDVKIDHGGIIVASWKTQTK
jgi:Holliday junction resolvase RusA-like endonuclease